MCADLGVVYLGWVGMVLYGFVDIWGLGVEKRGGERGGWVRWGDGGRRDGDRVRQEKEW